jgi:hypothetical protein
MRSTGEKRQGTARTPRRYRANWGSGSRASVLECALSPLALFGGKSGENVRTPAVFYPTHLSICGR